MNPRIDTNPLTVEDTAWAVATDIADQWQHAWNAADHIGYSEPFLPDADYLTIQGDHLKGREEIAAGAAVIFATIYANSTLAARVVEVRCPAPTVVVAQVEHVLDAPTGPLAGVNTTLATIVVVDTSEGWQVATLHNTLVAPPT